MTEPPAPEPHDPTIPPGQHVLPDPPVMHYGRIPDRDLADWRLTIGGATASGSEHEFTLPQVTGLPEVTITADMHCATSWTARDLTWTGVLARDVVELAPPDPAVETVLVFAEFGYAANVPLPDLLGQQVLLATHCGGEPLTAERGAPVRLVIPHLYTWKGPKWLRGWNYLLPEDPDRGFWEQRGYHPRGDAWRQERFAHQG